MFRSTYLKRLFLFGMILVTIPVISLGSLSYYKAKGIIEDKMVEANMQVLSQTQSKIEQNLQLIDNSINQFINTPLVNQALRTSFRAKDYRNVYDLSEGLYKLQAYELGLQNVQLISFQQGWSIDNSSFTASLTQEELAPYKEMAGLPQLSNWVFEEPTASVLLVKKLPINTLRDPQGLITARMPNYRMLKLIPNNNADSEILLFDAEHRLLAKAEDSSFPPEIVEQVTRELQAFTEEEGYRNTRIHEGTFGISYRKSPYNGWIYVSLVSIEQITKETSVIGLYTVLICSVIFLILLVLSLIGARKMYSPVRKVFEAALGGSLPEHSRSKDEFKIIGERIHSLRTTQSTLLAQIQGQTRQLKEFFVRKLLLGELNVPEMKEKAEAFQYDISSTSFCVLTVQIDTLEGTRFHNRDHDLLMFAVNNIASELIPGETRLEPVVIGRNQVTLLKWKAEAQEEGKNVVYALAETIQRKVRDILELKVSIGISGFHQGLPLAAKAYRESLEALKYRIRFGEEAVLHFEDVLPNHRVQSTFPEWIEKQMIDALKVPDLEKAKQLLHEFLKTTLRENIRHQEYQMILFRLLAELIREIQSAGENLESSSEDERQLFEQLFELKTVHQIEGWFVKKVFEPMVLLLNKKWDSQNKNISDQMKEIIHNGFESDLSLDRCAALLNYHPNYLKTVFRKETGVNFSDYVSQYRLNQAKKWLLETDMKVTEIAERLQYQNSQNFIRYFRKMEDMTPGEYRKTYRNP